MDMQRTARPRRYVSSVQLYALFPFLRYSYDRSAYVLRFVGENRGPVLRRDRRQGRQTEFAGNDRRAPIDHGVPELGRMS
jgi:hypothetical protein